MSGFQKTCSFYIFQKNSSDWIIVTLVVSNDILSMNVFGARIGIFWGKFSYNMVDQIFTNC